MKQGIILKGVGGLYTVRLDEGSLIACRPRGVFRHKHITPLPGDRCEVLPLDDGTGRLEALLPRRNELIRPMVCNVDIMLLVAAEVIPRSDPYLIDRLTAVAENQNIDVYIVVNKNDLSTELRIFNIYKPIYKTFSISAETGEGIGSLRAAIAGKTVVFTGNSGVGKSSILNALEPDMQLPTGEVSEHLGRGRHTTRHVELYPAMDGGCVIDTPGFSALDTATEIPTGELDACFPEFRPFLGQCRFTGCRHNHVLDCAVMQALERGEIGRSRHESYLRILADAEQAKPY